MDQTRIKAVLSFPARRQLGSQSHARPNTLPGFDDFFKAIRRYALQEFLEIVRTRERDMGYLSEIPEEDYNTKEDVK